MNSDYQRGYEEAYAEIYAAIDSDYHPRYCDGCRACNLMRSVLEDALMTIGRMISPEDFATLAAIIQRANQSAD